MAAVMTNLRNVMYYERVEAGGLKKGPITAEKPLVDPYFTVLQGAKQKLQDDLSVCPLENVNGEYCLVNNGWIWAGDPAINFASSASNAYLRREVVIWGDCVKLRYGRAYDDNPWLWEYMAEYTRSVSRMAHGLRIDNCHSTPLHVGQYLVDVARDANPNCFVLGELFTNSDSADALYTATLGLNALVHEGMSRTDAKNFSTALHLHGGPPIGTFSELPHCSLPARALLPRACLFDATHDTHMPAQHYTYRHHLAMAALDCMVSNSIGSVRCFDEFIPVNEYVVNNKHLYRTWHDAADGSAFDPTVHVNLDCGMLRLRS